MIYVFYILFGILIAFGIIFCVGCTFDKERKHKKEVLIESPVQDVWNVVTKFDTQADWRKDLSDVVFLSNEKWMEISYEGRDLSFKIIEKKQLEYWKLSIYNGDKHIGYWIGRFTAIDKITNVVFIEILITKTPFMRVFNRIFFNMDKRMTIYVDSLLNVFKNL